MAENQFLDEARLSEHIEVLQEELYAIDGDRNPDREKRVQAEDELKEIIDGCEKLRLRAQAAVTNGLEARENMDRYGNPNYSLGYNWRLIVPVVAAAVLIVCNFPSLKKCYDDITYRISDIMVRGAQELYMNR